MMKLYLVHGCPFAHRATIALHEKAIAFDPHFFKPGARPEELEAVGAYAKSPTLFDDGAIVWDSQVVVEYIEDRYPSPALLPRDPAQRAEVRMLAARVGGELLAKQAPIVAEVLKPAEQRDQSKIAAASQAFLDALAPWDARLAGRDWVLGDSFGLADIVLYTPFPAIQRLAGVEVPAERSNLRAWLDRMAARPTTKLLSPS
jgi:glutathione S-transferase